VLSIFDARNLHRCHDNYKLKFDNFSGAGINQGSGISLCPEEEISFVASGLLRPGNSG
jgi:hypothetical protein